MVKHIKKFRGVFKMKKIFVTKSYLPPMEEYVEKISKIWDNHFLTNSGPLCLEFTEKLKK